MSAGESQVGITVSPRDVGHRDSLVTAVRVSVVLVPSGWSLGMLLAF